MPGEVRPRTVMSPPLGAVVGRHLRVPLLLSFGQPLVEILKTLLEVAPVRGVKLRQLAGDAARDTPAIVGIQPVMRVPQRMNVPHGAGDGAGRLVQDLGKLRSIEISS